MHDPPYLVFLENQPLTLLTSFFLSIHYLEAHYPYYTKKSPCRQIHLWIWWKQPENRFGWSMGIYSNIGTQYIILFIHRLMNIMVGYRVHMPKVKQSSIFPNITPTCGKCINSDATLIHPWADVFKTILNILGQDLDPHPLGIPERNDLNLTSTEWYMITFTSRLTRCAVLPRWKDAAPSTVISGSKDIKYWFKLWMLRFSTKGSQKKKKPKPTYPNT